LLNSTQEKISKKYINSLDNKDNDDNNLINQDLILPDEIKLLQATKEKVEKQVLDGKKGSALTNAFSFFFGGKKDNEANFLKKKSETEKKTDWKKQKNQKVDGHKQQTSSLFS